MEESSITFLAAVCAAQLAAAGHSSHGDQVKLQQKLTGLPACPADAAVFGALLS